MIAAAALALPTAAHAEEAQVDMFSTAFNPAKLTVVAGDTVTWRNGDIVVHDVKGGTFTSGIIGRFESFSQRFDTAGTVNYLCSLHLGMGRAARGAGGAADRAGRVGLRGRDDELKGRTMPGAVVTLERDAGGWQPAGSVTASADGTFKASVEAAAATARAPRRARARR